MKLIITAHGFDSSKICQEFIALLGKKLPDTTVGIITTASVEWKEKNKHAIAVKNILAASGFKSVQFIDVEFQSADLLNTCNAIYINGGNPFYLLYHLKKSGADSILKKRAHQGSVIVGSSAGALVLGPSIEIANFFTPEMNTMRLHNLSALNLVPFTVYPHYQENVEDKIKEFESTVSIPVKRLKDTDALVISGGQYREIGEE